MSNSLEERRPTNVGALELIAAMVLSGTIGVFVVESGADPFTVVFFRCVFGAIALGTYCLLRGFFTNTGFTAKTLGLAALGGVFIVFNWAFLFESYHLTSITLGTVIYHTQPFYVVILGSIIFKEQLTKAKIGWVVVAFVGVVLVSNLLVTGAGTGAGHLLGMGSALLAAVLYAFATLIAKRIKGIKPHLIALVQVVIGIPLLLPFVTFGDLNGLGAGWGWLIGLGVIHTGVMYVLMYSSYQKLPTATIAVLSFIYPAVALVVDMMVYGTRINPLQALGMVVIVTASLGISLGWKPLSRRSAETTTTDKTSPTDETTKAGAR